MNDDAVESVGYLICSIAAFLYILSPIDIIPDFIPVIGYLDDIAVGIAGIAAALRAIALMLPLLFILGVVMLIVKLAC